MWLYSLQNMASSRYSKIKTLTISLVNQLNGHPT
jgi:hypothetical protein